MVFILPVTGRTGVAQGVCAWADVDKTGTLKQNIKYCVTPKSEVQSHSQEHMHADLWSHELN